MDPLGALLIVGRTAMLFGGGWLLRGWVLDTWNRGDLGGRSGMLVLFGACLLQVLGVQSLFWEDGIVPWQGFVAVVTILLAVAYTVVEYRRSVRDHREPAAPAAGPDDSGAGGQA